MPSYAHSLGACGNACLRRLLGRVAPALSELALLWPPHECQTRIAEAINTRILLHYTLQTVDSLKGLFQQRG
jgi:hypothetical protein